MRGEGPVLERGYNDLETGSEALCKEWKQNPCRRVVIGNQISSLEERVEFPVILLVGHWEVVL